MERIAINEASTFAWSFHEDVARYATFGYPGIGIWRHKITDYGDSSVAELLRDAGMQVSSLQWVGGFTGNDAMSFHEALEDAVAAIRTASIIQAGCLIVHPGSDRGHTASHARRLTRLALDELVPIARDFNVRLAIEPMRSAAGRDFTFVSRFDAAMELVGEYPADHLGLVVDLFYFGCEPEQFDAVSGLAPRLALVQLADRIGPLTPRSRRCLPGCGDLPIADWVKICEANGYRGFYEVEVYGEDDGHGDGFQTLDRLARFAPHYIAARATPADEPRRLGGSHPHTTPSSH